MPFTCASVFAVFWGTVFALQWSANVSCFSSVFAAFGGPFSCTPVVSRCFFLCFGALRLLGDRSFALQASGQPVFFLER